MNGIYMYMFILFAQILQNAISTFRFALMARGEKFLNTILCFFQSLLGMSATAFALCNLKEDPLQAVFYILGATLGFYFGMLLEEKLAIGQNIVTVIVNDDKGNNLTKKLRDKGYAVTVLDGQGIKAKRSVLMIGVNRKKEKKLLILI